MLNNKFEFITEEVYNQKKEEMIKIALLLKEKNGINDHSGEKLYGRHKPIGVALTAKGEIGLLIVYNYVYCLNEVYINEKDGLPHLSKWSIGNNIWNNDIERYNNECVDSCNIIETLYLKDIA